MAKRGNQLKGILLLLLTAFIWGSSFVAQGVGMEKIQAFTFGGIRTLMGAAVLLPIILFKEFRGRNLPGEKKAERKALNIRSVKSGLILGVILFAASNFQQFSFNYTSPDKVAFVTAFYMLFVPIFGLFFKIKSSLVSWLCGILGCVGLYFLCVHEVGLGNLNRGDVLAFICSIFYALHILAIEKLAPKCDALVLSFTQFLVSGTITSVLMFIFETPDIGLINQAIIPILYSGVLSCGVAYTLQVVGQQYTEPTLASLIMCLESVFGVICTGLYYKEWLSKFEFLGCGIMFAAIIISQVAPKRSKAQQ